MLIDIKFHSWEKIETYLDPSGLDPSPMANFIHKHWVNYLSPEALRSNRLQKGVYQKGLSFDNLLEPYSDFELVNRYRPVPSDFKEAMEDLQRVLENGEPGEWYGRGDDVDQIVEYLKPTWEKEDRYFIVQVCEYKNADNIEKPWKMGCYIGDPDNEYERMQNGFWTFHMIEIKPPLDVQ